MNTQHHAGHSYHLDFNRAPFLVIWETTRACDLACVHCRAEATPERSDDELSTEEGMKLIADVKDMGTPILIFSGGDPLKRPDLETLIAHAKSLHLRTGAIPAVTPALTRERLAALAAAGLDQVAFSLDAADAEEHEKFRRVPGVYARTLEAARMASELGMKLQINSLLNVHNLDRFEALAELVASLGIVFWEIFFLVPTGRGRELPLLEPERFRAAFEKIHAIAERASFVVKVTEAPHYRRFIRERQLAQSGGAPVSGYTGTAVLRRNGHAAIGQSPQGVNSGKGFLFVSHKGEICPSGFLPISAGNVRELPLAQVYREAPLFLALRDFSLLKGRCGVCDTRDLCGGSRARAWAVTGNYLESDPCCFYDSTA